MPSLPEVLKERRKNDQEYANKVREYARAYREHNVEKERERQRLDKEKRRTENKEVNNAYMREWNAKNSVRLNAEKRKRRLNDHEYAERIRANDRARHLADPSRSRKQNLKSMYGITLEDYQLMYTKQNGKCAICDTWCEDKGKMGLVVDHCHNTKKVRSLLCTHCNKGIGQFRESISFLQNAIAYLTKYKI